MKKYSFFFVLAAQIAALAKSENPNPSYADCARDDSVLLNSCKDVSTVVKAWEQGKRAETFKWFEENQFGRTPIGKLKDQKFEESAVVFEQSGIRINITCRFRTVIFYVSPVILRVIKSQWKV